MLEEKDQQITDLQSQLAEKEKYTYTGEEVGKIEQNYDNQLAIIEKALELACERVKYFEEMQDREMGHFELFGYDIEYDLQAIIEQYKQQAKEMLENEQ